MADELGVMHGHLHPDMEDLMYAAMRHGSSDGVIDGVRVGLRYIDGGRAQYKMACLTTDEAWANELAGRSVAWDLKSNGAGDWLVGRVYLGRKPGPPRQYEKVLAALRSDQLEALRARRDESPWGMPVNAMIRAAVDGYLMGTGIYRS